MRRVRWFGSSASTCKLSRPRKVNGQGTSADLSGAATACERTSFGCGERVTAARTMETPQGLWIPAGSEGTITEDRGSTLMVFFHHQTPPISLRVCDLRKPIDPRHE